MPSFVLLVAKMPVVSEKINPSEFTALHQRSMRLRWWKRSWIVSYPNDLAHSSSAEFMRSRNIRTPSDYAKFNTVFPGKVGKPSHVAQAVLAMIDGTTGWKSGDVVVMDNDATYHVHEHYKVATIVKDEIWRIDRTKVYDVTGNHLYDFEKVKSDL